MWRNCLSDISEMTASIPAREAIFQQMKMKPIFDSVDLCLTWEVSLGGENRGRSLERGISFISSTCEMGCGPLDSAVHESKGWDTGVVGRGTIDQIFTERNEMENLGECR